jgi:AcrR family transcriptional regulator
VKERKKESILMTSLRLFSRNGFHDTTIPLIAKEMRMSVGNIYNYFPSKNNLAKCAIKFASSILASTLRKINEKDMSTKEKIEHFVESYYNIIEISPEIIEYFLRVYLSNRSLFQSESDGGFELAKDFIDEVEKLMNEGIKKRELRKQNFFVSFSVFIGTLGGMTFLNGENVLDKKPIHYSKEISNSIYNALKI